MWVFNPFTGKFDNTYSDAEAVAAMGGLGDGNPLNHDRYLDAEAAVVAAGLIVIHSALADPHTVYVKKSSFTANEDFLVGTGAGSLLKKTPAQVMAILSGEASSAFSLNGQLLYNMDELAFSNWVGQSISGGAVTCSSTLMRIDTEGGDPSDDLVNINSALSGQLLFIRPESSARTIVVKHATGNIWLRGGLDISLTNREDCLGFIWDSYSSKWLCFGSVRYTDAEAVTAMGAKGDSNPLNHDRYTDIEALAVAIAARYTDAEAVTAMGAKADNNPLNHDKYLDAAAKAAAIAGWTASRALQVSAGGSIEASPVTLAELNYLDGVTSALQAQIDGKVAKSLYDANSILAAVNDNDPAVLAVAASRILGRKASGNIAALTIQEILALLLTTKGDLLAYSTTPLRLGVGTNGHMLMADSAQAGGMKWAGTLMTDLDFAKYKAIAMVCDNGATVPATPTTGQWFLHTPTGRNILMIYDGSNWIPIISLGNMTVYVDAINGVDAIDNGGTVDGGADTPFATIQYAVNRIPGLFGGYVYIYASAGTYAETVSIGGKVPTGSFYIVISGTLVEVSSGTSSANGVIGTAAQQPIVTDAGNMGSAGGYLCYLAADANYRVIDESTWQMGYISMAHWPAPGECVAVDTGAGTHTGAWGIIVSITNTGGYTGSGYGVITYIPCFGTFADGDTLDLMMNEAVHYAGICDVNAAQGAIQEDTNNIALIGPLSSQPLSGEAYVIYDWGTKINNMEVLAAQVNVILYDLETIAASSYGIWCFPGSSSSTVRCRHNNAVLAQGASLSIENGILEYVSQGWNLLLCQAFAYVILRQCKISKYNNVGNIISCTTTSIAIQGCIITGASGADKATSGVYGSGETTIIFYTTAGFGRNWIRACDIGAEVVESSVVTWTTGWFLSLCGNDLGLKVEVGGDNSTILSLAEQASSFWTSVAGEGTFWVKNDAPNVPMFTDDAGTDFNITIV